ncbi:MAG: PP2C family protein-serine/threonine phosphatase [Candidatus Schekmanbacteria bacterium]|nr:PP2C family protein-serine/threonine phosphatase [Candidatus Schekmanbacteria bacterium]
MVAARSIEFPSGRETALLLALVVVAIGIAFTLGSRTSGNQFVPVALSPAAAGDAADAALQRGFGVSAGDFGVSRVTRALPSTQVNYLAGLGEPRGELLRRGLVARGLVYAVRYRSQSSAEQYDVEVQAADGAVVSLRRVRSDRGSGAPPLEREAARLRAESALRDLGLDLAPFVFQTVSPMPSQNRVDQVIHWEATRPSWPGIRLVLEAVLAGEVFDGYTIDLKLDKDLEKTLSDDLKYPQLAVNARIGVTGLLMLVAVIVAFRKWRAEELAPGRWTLFATLPLIFFVIQQWQSMQASMYYGQDAAAATSMAVVNFVLVFPIAALLFWALFAAGEAMWSDTRPGMFASYTALINGRFSSRRLAGPLLRGAAYGAALGTAVTTGLSALIALGISLPVQPFICEALAESPAPKLHAFGALLLCLGGTVGTFHMFLQGALTALLKRPLVALLITAVLALTPPLWANSAITPPWLIVPASLGISVVLAGVLLQFGFLTCAVAYVSYGLTAYVMPESASVSMPLTWPGVAGAILLSALCAWGLRCRLSPESAADLDDLLTEKARSRRQRELLQRELDIARDVQLALLPAELPAVAGITLRALCRPAQIVGGDFYDVVQGNDGHIGLVIGDVSGKGMTAAFYMAQAMGILQAFGSLLTSPKEVLARANDLLRRRLGKGMFITSLYCTLDTRHGVLRFVRAGHLPLLLLRRGAVYDAVPHAQGLGLGLVPSPMFRQATSEVELQLAPGDVVLLYTDGVTEHFNAAREEFGEDRLRALLGRSASLPLDELEKRIMDELDRYRGAGAQHDDVTLLMLSWDGVHHDELAK